MMPPPPLASTAADACVDTPLEQLKIIFSAVPSSLAAVLFNAVVLSAVLWDQVSHAAILAWLGAIAGVCLYRWLVYRSFVTAAADQQAQNHWRRLSAAGILLSGLVWGSTSLFLFPAQSMVHQVFLAFVLAGMSAGAVATLSAIYSLSAGFLVISLLPLTLPFLVSPDALSEVMAMMAALFAVMLLTSSRRLNKTILDSLQIRHERHQAQNTIRYQALYDELTQLPNRRLLLERLGLELARSIRHGHCGAVLFLDLDHFKTINDSPGHPFDDLLGQVRRPRQAQASGCP